MENINQYWETWSSKFHDLSSNLSYEKKDIEEMIEKIACIPFLKVLTKKSIVAVALQNRVEFIVIILLLIRLKCNTLILPENTTADELRRLKETVPVEVFISKNDWNIDDAFCCVSPQILGTQIDPLYIYQMDFPKEPTNTFESCFIFPSSGTTGVSKYCVRSEEAVLNDARNYVETFVMDKSIKIHIAVPFSHNYGFAFGFICAIVLNSYLVFSDVFNPKKLLKYETENTSDLLITAPIMIDRINELQVLYKRFKLPLEVFFAGAPIGLKSYKLFGNLFDSRLIGIYGMTEAGGISSTYRCEHPELCSGKPLKNVSLNLNHLDRSFETSFPHRFSEGELIIRSNAFMESYYGETPRGDELRTGDLAEITTHGCFKIIGRIKSMINVHGKKIVPMEISDILLTFPGVEDAIAYPGMDTLGNEQVCAVFVSKQYLNSQVLKEYCSKKLAPHKVPWNLEQIDCLPRNATGKIDYRRLPNYML